MARCQWCGPVLQVEPLAPAICYPRRRLSPHPDAPIPGVMARHSLRRGHRRAILYLPDNLISLACRNLTRHAGSVSRTHTALQLSQHISPLGHEGRLCRWIIAINILKLELRYCNPFQNSTLPNEGAVANLTSNFCHGNVP